MSVYLSLIIYERYVEGNHEIEILLAVKLKGVADTEGMSGKDLRL